MFWIVDKIVFCAIRLTSIFVILRNVVLAVHIEVFSIRRIRVYFRIVCKFVDGSDAFLIMKFIDGTCALLC
jgi:hypothetical protein